MLYSAALLRTRLPVCQTGSHLILQESSMKNVQQIHSSLHPIRTDSIQNICEKRTFTAQFYGERGKVVVLLHGFPDDYLTFSEQIPCLVNAGYRVLVPVLPGYETSSVDPEGHYHLVDLARWLVSWLDLLEQDKVHLVGHDWGALIAWMAGSMYPERFYSLTTIAIPSLRHLPNAILSHPSQLLNSWYIGLFQIPGLAEMALGAGDGWLIRQLWRRWSPGWDAPAAHIDRVCQQLSQPQVRQAALGYYRSLFHWQAAEHREGRQWLWSGVKIPVLMISGALDGCMDTRLFDKALVEHDFPAGVELYRIGGAGHFCHLEKPDLVNHKLTQFIQGHEAASGAA